MKITKRQLKRIIKEAVSDNVSIQVYDDSNESYVRLDVPYYIITDAIDDGLSVDGLFIEIEEFIDSKYTTGGSTWSFTEKSDKEIRKIYQDYQEGGAWSDERDYEAGFHR